MEQQREVTERLPIAIPFLHGNLLQLLVRFCALHLSDAHSVDLRGVVNRFFSCNVTVITFDGCKMERDTCLGACNIAA